LSTHSIYPKSKPKQDGVKLKETVMDNKAAKQNFIDMAIGARRFLFNILLAYDQISAEDNEKTAENYPFVGSFDEWICEYDLWIETLKENFFPESKTYKPTIMVKDLKAILNEMDDDIQIVIRDEKSDWWLNIESLELPNEDDGHFTLTFNPKDNFDNRQF
jgi:hypothetical protein